MTKLSLQIENQNCNGSMSFKCFTKKRILGEYSGIEEGVHLYNFDIKLPTAFYMLVTGKDNNVDTVVENGKIVKDKCLIIKDIVLDYKPVKDTAIYKMIKLKTTSGEEIVSNYIGFNGIVEIDLNYDDSLLAHLHINKML